MPTRPTASILAHFQELEDPRISPATRHQLLDIVAIAGCAVICGADTWVEVEAFGHAKRDWLGTFLALRHGIPSHDTFGRVFAALDPDQFAAGFRSWVAAVAQVSTGSVVAIDGKTLRRARDVAQGQEALVLVSAWAEANRLTLGQVAVEAGSNEIRADPGIAADAGAGRDHRHRRCHRLPDGDRHADYRAGCGLRAGAERQPADAARTRWRSSSPRGRAHGFVTGHHDYRRTVEKGHGRIEVRQVWTVDDPEVLADLNPQRVWPQLRSVGRWWSPNATSATERSREARCYLSSLPSNAAALGDCGARSWGD